MFNIEDYLDGWNEGFDIGYGEGYEKAREELSENSGVEKYKTSLLKNITKLEQVFSTVGDNYRAQAYEDIIYLIENFDA